jgi:hypothetical protein
MGGTLRHDQNNWIAKTPSLFAILAPDFKSDDPKGMGRQ